MKKVAISPDTTKERPVYSAPALEKGFNVIELLSQRSTGLTASEIATGLGLSISEIFRIIIVMERRGYLSKSNGDRYHVTPLILSLAFRATPAEEISAVALPEMRDLSLKSDQSCHLVIRNRDKGLVISRIQNPGPTGFHVRVGTEINLETTCSGHVLLAFSSLDGGDGPSDGPFSNLLRVVEARGYERMESQRTLGVTDISYPIFDLQGNVCAALTVPFMRVIDGGQLLSIDDTQALLGETATRISQKLGSNRV